MGKNKSAWYKRYMSRCTCDVQESMAQNVVLADVPALEIPIVPLSKMPIYHPVHMVDAGTSSDDLISVKHRAVNTKQSWLKSYEIKQ